MQADDAMAAPCPLLGDGITDDTLLHIASFIPTAKDLLCLQLACPRFAAKVIAAPCVGSGGAAGAAAAAPEMLSIVEEAGRLWVAGCSAQERGWVPRVELESWLCLMHEVQALLVPLEFGRAHGSITLSEGGAVATRGATNTRRAAASTVAMRSGRHFAQFTLMEGYNVLLGVIRPGWDVEGGQMRRSTTATASTSRPMGEAAPAVTIGRGCSPRKSRATASACCLTSIRAASPSGRTTRSWA